MPDMPSRNLAGLVLTGYSFDPEERVWVVEADGTWNGEVVHRRETFDNEGDARGLLAEWKEEFDRSRYV